LDARRCRTARRGLHVLAPSDQVVSPTFS
jgi:hypothetical protein